MPTGETGYWNQVNHPERAYQEWLGCFVVNDQLKTSCYETPSPLSQRGGAIESGAKLIERQISSTCAVPHDEPSVVVGADTVRTVEGGWDSKYQHVATGHLDVMKPQALNSRF
ncbi:MAG: hypothetical protein ACREXX_22075 [Gammaproteobacteria bacterium]